MSMLMINGEGNVGYYNGQKTQGNIVLRIDYPMSQDGVTVDYGDLKVSIHVPFHAVLAAKKINVDIFGAKTIEFQLDSNMKSGQSYVIPGGGILKGRNAFIEVFIDMPSKYVSEEDREKLTKALEDVYGKSPTTIQITASSSDGG